VAILRLGAPPDPLVDAFKEGLRELGYVEGKTVHIDYGWAGGSEARLAGFAREFVQRKVDIILANATEASIAKSVTSTTPIVMAVGVDPVRGGLIASYAHPGGNVTGLVSQADELPGKWIELLKETFPKISRVALLSDADYEAGYLKLATAAAQARGLRLQGVSIRGDGELEGAFDELRKSRAQALMVSGSPLMFSLRVRIVSLALKQHLPTIHNHSEYVLSGGGFLSYGPDYRDLFRRAAGYVDKILKGARPADLPVEQPTKFELVVNMKTAQALGLKVPQSVLSRADRIIQ